MDYKWVALTVTTVGAFMGGLDDRIVTVGLPTIAKQLHTGPAELIWVTQAYLLAITIGLLLVGRIADTSGRVKVYTAGLAIFTIASALCSLSIIPSMLIAFRVVQGVGVGILFSSGAAIVTDASPKRELGTMLGVNQASIRLGDMVGLTLSGLILAVTDWRGLFYVNIPIGIFAVFWARRRLREIGVKDKSTRIDWVGFGLFSTGLTLVLLAMTFLGYGEVGTTGGFGLLIAGSALIALFVKWETTITYPLLDLKLFRITPFATGCIAQMLNSVSVFGVLLLLTLYLQIGLGYTPLQTGLGFLPLDVALLASTLAAGKITDRYGARSVASLGLLMNTLAILTLSTFGATAPYLDIVAVLLVLGLGSGFFNTPNTTAIMSSVPVNRRGIASGFRSTMFNVGAASSYGVVLLLITQGISYGAFSVLLQGGGTPAAIAVAKTEFMQGFRITALVLGAVSAAATMPSMLRGRSTVPE